MSNRNQTFSLVLILVLTFIFGSIWIGITQLDPESLTRSSDQTLLANRALTIMLSVVVFAILAIATTVIFTLVYRTKHLSRRAETIRRIEIYEQLRNELWYAERLLEYNAARPSRAVSSAASISSRAIRNTSSPAANTSSDYRHKIVPVDFSALQ